MTEANSEKRQFSASAADFSLQAREAGWNFWRPFAIAVVAVGLLRFPLF